MSFTIAPMKKVQFTYHHLQYHCGFKNAAVNVTVFPMKRKFQSGYINVLYTGINKKYKLEI